MATYIARKYGDYRLQEIADTFELAIDFWQHLLTLAPSQPEDAQAIR